MARAAPSPPGVTQAALGPQTLRLDSQMADGVMTWLTGPATIERHVVPRVLAAAP